MVRPRNSSTFSLLDRPIVLWDEPGQVRAAAERFWKRLEQIERSPAYDPDRIYFQWEDLARQAADCPQVEFKELEVGLGRGRPAYRHAALAGVPREHAGGDCGGPDPGGGGNRVAFFASSTGEVERLADILNEYGIPYQLGLEQFESHAGLPGGAGLYGRRRRRAFTW